MSDEVMAAFAGRRLIPPFTDREPSLSEEGAYQIAAEVHRRRVRRGETPVGRKIGFTNRTIWPEYGVWAPIWGYVYSTTVRPAYQQSVPVAIGQLLQPRLEPEVQLHFATPPPLTRDEVAILECVDWMTLGYEIVQCPYPDWRFRAADAIAAYALHGCLIVGTPVAVSDPGQVARQLRSFTVSMTGPGMAAHTTGGGANVLDSPTLAVAHLVELVAAQPQFGPIRAGEIVSTGSLTPLRPVSPGETWTTTALGIDLPDITVTLA